MLLYKCQNHSLSLPIPNKKAMSKEELQSYRLNSMEEPTDDMLEAIMLGVQEAARQSTIRVKEELSRRMEELKRQIEERRKE